MIKLFKQLEQSGVRLLVGAALLATTIMVGVLTPALAYAAPLQSSNWGKLYSNNSLSGSPMCLTSMGQGNSVSQSRCNNSSLAQRWHFNQQPDGYYIIQSADDYANNYGICLDVYAFNHDNYGLVTKWPCNPGFSNQRWQVNWVTGDSFALKPAHSIYDGFVYYAPGVYRYKGKCLDVFGFSHISYAPVVQWECNGAVNQQWTYWP